MLFSITMITSKSSILQKIFIARDKFSFQIYMAKIIYWSVFSVIHDFIFILRIFLCFSITRPFLFCKLCLIWYNPRLKEWKISIHLQLSIMLIIDMTYLPWSGWGCKLNIHKTFYFFLNICSSNTWTVPCMNNCRSTLGWTVIHLSLEDLFFIFWMTSWRIL